MAGNMDIPELDHWEDAFENQVAERTNVMDIAGHYPYSPERWRLFVDGSRVFPEYGAVSQYGHAGDYHELKPAAGETVTMESAERPRYVVQYELAATFAFAVNQSLQSGDSIRVGLYDGSNGWYMEHLGDQADDVADFVLERAGSEVYRKTDINISKEVTTNARLKLQTGWYDITRQIWERSYPDDGEQVNDNLIETSTDKRGSKTGNLPLHFSVSASSETTSLILEAGSCAQVNLGTTTPFNRAKVLQETVTLSTTGTWVPLLALRADPARDIVNTQISDIAISEFDGNADIKLSVQACSPTNVLEGDGTQLDDADYSTPETTLAQNNVLERSDAVAQFPDNTGTTTTSTNSPGGFQIGFDTLQTGGGNAVTSDPTVGGDTKRPIYGRDTAVVIANAGGTGDVTFQFRVEEDW